MKTLKEHITEAESTKTAIGHFNISNLEGFWAIVNASKKLNLPVIIGVSEGERNFVGAKQIKALVDSVRGDGLNIYLNADHTYTLNGIREVVEFDFDEVIIDAADKEFAENVKIVKDAVEIRNTLNKNVLVEAELGFIGKSSKILDSIPDGAEFSDEMMTKVDEAREFVESTKVDLLAPAVGNIHGMVKSGHNPKINIKRIKEIREACGVPLVLHGGSGISDEDFKGAIEAGISIVHINTEIRVAFRNSLEKSLLEFKNEVAPYKYMLPTIESMQEVIESRLKLFNS
jgi:fructose-bisphosphate aldolase, class II